MLKVIIIFFKMRQCGIWEEYKILAYIDPNKNLCHLLASVFKKLLLKLHFSFLRLSFSPRCNRIAS